MLNPLSPPVTRRVALYAALTTCLGHSPMALALVRKSLEFPRDHGAHPDFRLEWWYLTGYLNTAEGAASYGFQVTFFRSRVLSTQHLRSKLAAKQLVFAHVALTDVRHGALWHDQRIARSSGLPPSANAPDVATTATHTTAVKLKDWLLTRQGDRLQARASAENFELQLALHATQPLLLQGDQGLSRKGPQPEQASYYYSQPQLQVTGSLGLQGIQHPILAGSTAWLDHEWSQQMLHPLAVGWDWIGINMLDGGALTAFRLRTRDGTALWGGGSYRAQEASRSFGPEEVTFTPGRTWQSPRSRAVYPVEWWVRTPVGRFAVRAVIDQQELDSTNSTGAIYWEGLSEVQNEDARLVGRGYLEMTGYAAPLRLTMDAS